MVSMLYNDVHFNKWAVYGVCGYGVQFCVLAYQNEKKKKKKKNGAKTTLYMR